MNDFQVGYAQVNINPPWASALRVIMYPDLPKASWMIWKLPHWRCPVAAKKLY